MHKVIADSFEGECALDDLVRSLKNERQSSKADPDASMFYRIMHGEDWEAVVDCDTASVLSHVMEIKCFFHQPLTSLKCDILMIGTQEDRCVSTSSTYLADTYGRMIQEIGHGSFFIFATGDHPALISNTETFCNIAKAFLI